MNRKHPSSRIRNRESRIPRPPDLPFLSPSTTDQRRTHPNLIEPQKNIFKCKHPVNSVNNGKLLCPSSIQAPSAHVVSAKGGSYRRRVGRCSPLSPFRRGEGSVLPLQLPIAPHSPAVRVRITPDNSPPALGTRDLSGAVGSCRELWGAMGSYRDRNEISAVRIHAPRGSALTINSPTINSSGLRTSCPP